MTAPHVADQVPAYLAGALPADEQAALAAHVARCDDCRRELRSWSAVAEAARALEAQAPRLDPAVFARIAARVEERPARGVQVRWLWRFVVRQASLLRPAIWVASAVVMAMGAAITWLSVPRDPGGTLFALVAPLIAGAGVAFVYGPENDASLELALATPTSPRLVLLARLTLVLAWDTLLALAASLLLGLVPEMPTPLALVSAWLGPMLALSAFSLVLSLVIGSSQAIVAALAFWTARVLLGSDRGRDVLMPGVADVVVALWQTTPLSLGLAACLLLVAFALVPGSERFVASGD